MQAQRYPTPIVIDRDRPTATHFAFEWVKCETRQVHVVNGVRAVQGRQLHPQPFGMARLDTRSVTSLKELAQALASK